MKYQVNQYSASLSDKEINLRKIKIEPGATLPLSMAAQSDPLDRIVDVYTSKNEAVEALKNHKSRVEHNTFSGVAFTKLTEYAVEEIDENGEYVGNATYSEIEKECKE